MPETLSDYYAAWLGAYLAMLASACVFDGASGRIPNPVVLAGMALGLVLASTSSGIGLSSAVPGLLVGGAVPALFYRMGVLGAGDVKLLAASGAFVGLPNVLYVLLATAVAGGVLSGAAALRGGRMRDVLVNLRAGMQHAAVSALVLRRMPDAAELPAPTARVPYALAITAGALVQLTFWGVSP